MARNRTVVDAPVEAVFAVLADPRTYDDFVVGTKRIRRFEPTWPELGSALQHTLGVGPFVLRDATSVEEVDGERRLVPSARRCAHWRSAAWHSSSARSMTERR